jgi:trehalose/maltose hydrolase-like predicted phosphorylase
MLFYLFSPGALRAIFERLGYEYGPGTAARNIAYYDQRTSHGSTLSYVTFAGAIAGLDSESSWERFLVALRSDVDDIQGGTTREGIHMGVMSGTLDLMQRGYSGSEISDGVLRVEPRLPAAIEEVSFWLHDQLTTMHVTQNQDLGELNDHREGAGGPIQVAVGGEVGDLCPGDKKTFELAAATPSGERPSRV